MLSSTLLVSLTLIIEPGEFHSISLRSRVAEAPPESRACPAFPMGELPMPVGSITEAAFATKVRSIRGCFDVGVPEESRRLHCEQDGNKCSGGPNGYPQHHAKMSVFPIDDSHKIDPDVLPANGVIVAKIHNLASTTWARYHVPDNGNVPKNWYLILVDDGVDNDAAKIQIIGIRRSAENNGQASRLIPLDPDDYYRLCHAHESTDYPEAQFSDCEVSASMFRSSAHDNAAVRSLLTEYRFFQPRGPKDGVWLRCSLGCCSTGPL